MGGNVVAHFQEKPKHVEGLLWRSLDDGVVIVEPESGQVRVLNGAGAFIWQLVDGHRTVRELQMLLVDRYQVVEARALADLDHFLGELTERQLLVWQDKS
jgi:hypothetical protein